MDNNLINLIDQIMICQGLREFVGVEVVSLCPCTLHQGHIEFVLALFG